MPRIFLVSRTVLGAGMQAVLQRSRNNDIRVLNCAEPEQILHQLKDFRPELSIWDETSFPVLTQLKRIGRGQVGFLGHIIVIAQDPPTEKKLFELLMWGCFACLTTQVSAEALLTTTQRVCEGECLMEGNTIDVPPSPQPPPPKLVTSEPTNPLSSREIEILGMVAKGNANKQIAKMLEISDQTVKNHLTSILHKLGKKDRTSAVTCALAHQWIHVPGFPQPEQRSASAAA